LFFDFVKDGEIPTEFLSWSPERFPPPAETRRLDRKRLSSFCVTPGSFFGPFSWFLPLRISLRTRASWCGLRAFFRRRHGTAALPFRERELSFGGEFKSPVCRGLSFRRLPFLLGAPSFPPSEPFLVQLPRLGPSLQRFFCPFFRVRLEWPSLDRSQFRLGLPSVFGDTYSTYTFRPAFGPSKRAHTAPTTLFFSGY